MTPGDPSPRSFPVLVDTPVWQDYFQKEDRIFREVNGLMDAGRVCCLDLIVAELLYAAETEEEIKVLQDFTQVFPVIREYPGVWMKAARLAFQLRQKKKKLSLRDSYVAVMAESHGALLYTPNKSFRQARRALDLKIEFFPDRRSE
jgi:predicted nucleic acid-binding protein